VAGKVLMIGRQSAACFEMLDTRHTPDT